MQKNKKEGKKRTGLGRTQVISAFTANVQVLGNAIGTKEPNSLREKKKTKNEARLTRHRSPSRAS
jgi:hypothetical protein